MLSGFVLMFFKALLFLTITIIAALSSAGLLFILVSIFSKSDNLIFDLINAIPSYLIITISINQILTIFLAILIGARILFNKKIKSYFIVIVFFLWLIFILFNILSTPSLLFQIQESGAMPEWIYDDFSYMYEYKSN